MGRVTLRLIVRSPTGQAHLIVSLAFKFWTGLTNRRGDNNTKEEVCGVFHVRMQARQGISAISLRLSEDDFKDRMNARMHERFLGLLFLEASLGISMIRVASGQ